MQYETNYCFSSAFQRAPAGPSSPARLQCTEPPVRKRSACPGHCLALRPHDHLRSSAAARLSARCEWESFCFVLGRRHQRDHAHHAGPEQSAAAGHDHHRPDLRSGNRQRDGQHPGRELWLCWLYQWWNQQGPRPDHHVSGSNGKKASRGRACQARASALFLTFSGNPLRICFAPRWTTSELELDSNWSRITVDGLPSRAANRVGWRKLK
jgi:hypothetical protein